MIMGMQDLGIVGPWEYVTIIEQDPGDIEP